MSMITSVGSLDRSSIAPAVPATTMAALATSPPETGSFKVDTPGYAAPAGHTDRNESGPGGTTVMFSEYAPAVDGMLHVVEVGSGTVRPIYGVSEGGPNPPVK